MGRKQVPCLPLVLLPWLMTAAANASARPAVDAAVVLMIDASGSTGRATNAFNQQVAGFGAAIASRQVQAAIRAGFHGRIAIAAAVWSASPTDRPQLCTGWTLIATPADGEAFGDELRDRCTYLGGHTNASDAIEFGARLLEALPYETATRVIDVSTNGVTTDRRLQRIRNGAVASGITVNCLAFEPRPGDLRKQVYHHCEQDIAGGPFSFAMAMNGQNFQESLVRKLAQEIAQEQRRLSEPTDQYRGHRPPGVRALTLLRSRD